MQADRQQYTPISKTLQIEQSEIAPHNEALIGLALTVAIILKVRVTSMSTTIV